MTHSVANIRAHQYDLARACRALEDSTPQTRPVQLQVLRNLLFDARSQLQPHQKLDKYTQHFDAEFDAEFDVTIFQINVTQHKITVCGNTRVSTILAELVARLTRELQELQLTINSESCESHLCLWHYGVVKAFCGEKRFLLTFCTIDAYTRDVNAAREEYRVVWQYEPIGSQVEQLRKNVRTEILSNARLNSVISEEESNTLLRRGGMEIVSLCGILSAANKCNHHSCPLCKKLGNQSGDCSFILWMESRQQWIERAAANLLARSERNLQRRQGEMEYSIMLGQHARKWDIHGNPEL